MLIWTEESPLALWDKTFADLGAKFADAGLGTIVFASPFLSTVPGTDTYTDELW